MTIEQIQRHLMEAAEESAPPTRVTVAAVYRAGLRRRRVRRWCSVAALGFTAVGVAGGAAVVNAAPSAPLGGPATASRNASAQVASPAPLPPRSCRTLAVAVASATRSALPQGIRWEAPELPSGAEYADCAGGGIVWLSFSYQGQHGRLGFEGGVGFDDRGCAPDRKPVRCEQIDGGEVGHLRGDAEYGVLLSRAGVYFFLGLMDTRPGKQPLTTDELSTAAQRVDEEVFA
jgi:hypothetical protein